MQNLKLSWVLLLAAVLLTGCIDKEAPTKESMAGTTYTGVIPCADCSGIAYKLTLNEDKRYETRSVYIGKSNRPFIEHGDWNMQGDSMIVLDKSGENARQFKIKNDQLIMLDAQGKEVTGSLAKMYVLSEPDTSKTGDRWQQRRSRGVDFRAAGNEPSWNLDIDFDKMIAFKIMSGDSVSSPVPQMQKDSELGARVFELKSESGPVKVQLYPTGCVDDMSGEVFDYGVNVDYGGETYRGCGNFINEEYELNDFWSLQSLNGTPVDSLEITRDTPALYFDVAGQRISGNAGCNRLNGSMTLQDSSLSFSKVAVTKMACPGDLENRFLDAFNRVDSYDITNAELSLLNGTDTLMTFHRAE